MKVRLVFRRFLDLRGNLRIVKEKATGKTWFSREKKRLAPRIYQAKFCLAAFLSQRNLYYIFTRKRCWNGGGYIWKVYLCIYLHKLYKELYKSSSQLHKGFLWMFAKVLWKFYKSFIKKLHVYMLLKEHDDFLTTLCILSKCGWMNVF